MLGNRFVNYSGPGGVRRGMIWQSSTASNEEPDPHNFISNVPYGSSGNPYMSGYEPTEIGYRISGSENTVEPYKNGIFGYQTIVNDVGSSSHKYRYQQYIDNQAKIIFFDQIVLPDIYKIGKGIALNVYGDSSTDDKIYCTYSYTSTSSDAKQYYYVPFPYRIKGFCLVANMNCFFNTDYYNNIEHIDAKSPTEYYNQILNSYIVDFKYKTTTGSSNKGSSFGYKVPYSSLKQIDGSNYYNIYHGKATDQNTKECAKLYLGNEIYTSEKYIGIHASPSFMHSSKTYPTSIGNYYSHYDISCDSSNGSISLPDIYKVPNPYLRLDMSPSMEYNLDESFDKYGMGNRYDISGSYQTKLSPFYYHIEPGTITYNSDYATYGTTPFYQQIISKCGCPMSSQSPISDEVKYNYCRMLGIPIKNVVSCGSDGLCMESDFKKGEYLSFNINPFYSYCYEGNHTTENKTCDGGRYTYVGVNATVSPFCLTK